MNGPEGSPYAGGIFNVEILLPTEPTRCYPFQPPFFRFTTKLFHPNISSEAYHPILCPEGGEIKVSILTKGDWNPHLSIEKVLLSIQSLLTDPNPHDPFNREASEMLLNNPADYNRTVREWVLLFATPPAHLRPIHLVLNAAAACPLFSARSLRAHCLQPPTQLAPTLSQRLLDHALLQELLCRGNKQRVQLVCCSASLSALACCLSGVSHRSKVKYEHWWVIGSIMRRCYSIFSARARSSFHLPHGS
jgi:ubiquitin-conjugating enzyme E2 D/E